MTEWAAKRFWKETAVTEAEAGFTVTLDQRSLKTPAKVPLLLPSRAYAEAVAAEWDAQESKIDPGKMPLTRLANSAIDTVQVNRVTVADSLAEYGGSDLLCYRAETPAELVARQAAAWDPMLDWAESRFAARLTCASGVMFVAQPAESLAALRSEVHALAPFELAAFHDLVALSGSLILALAAIHDRARPEELWSWSRIDEDWQAEQWGADEEATAVATRKREEFLSAFRAFRLIRER